MSRKMDFDSALIYAKEQLGISFPLKDKQTEVLQALYYGKDCLAVLPTGYGKSLIFQLLPHMLKARNGSGSVIIISPLTGLMLDQLKRTISLVKSKACILESSGPKVVTTGDISNRGDSDLDSEDEELPGCTVSIKGGSLDDIRAGSFNMIFGHPEAFLSSVVGKSLIQDELFREKVSAIVYDEAHCVLEWGEDFRKDYGKLTVLGAFFPDIPHCALTATLSTSQERDVCVKLGLVKPEIISLNPDRPNIYLSVKILEPAGDFWEACDNVLYPIAHRLKLEKIAHPITLIYMKRAPVCGYAYSLFDSVLQDDQYVPKHCRDIQNRLFAQYHANYPKDMKKIIVDRLTSKTSTVRVIFATTALGMGLDVPNISDVIVIGPPGTIESFFQMSGRAGRNGACCTTTLYYTNSDIRKNAPGIRDGMRNLCKSSLCVRQLILNHLGHPLPAPKFRHTCCDRCRKSCNCDVCLVNQSLLDVALD